VFGCCFFWCPDDAPTSQYAVTPFLCTADIVRSANPVFCECCLRIIDVKNVFLRFLFLSRFFIRFLTFFYFDRVFYF